jgi:hypothetical protein
MNHTAFAVRAGGAPQGCTRVTPESATGEVLARLTHDLLLVVEPHTQLHSFICHPAASSFLVSVKPEEKRHACGALPPEAHLDARVICFKHRAAFFHPCLIEAGDRRAAAD